MGASVRIERTLRSMPPKLLQAYLVELGGEAVGEEGVRGPGWQASLKRIEYFQLGSIRVGQVEMILEGSQEALDALLPRLELKLLRAGA